MTTASNSIQNLSPWELIKRGETFESVICTFIEREQRFLFRVHNETYKGNGDASNDPEVLALQTVIVADTGLHLDFHDLKLSWVTDSCECCKNRHPTIIVDAGENLRMFINILSNELLELSRKPRVSKNIRTQMFVWLTPEESLVCNYATRASLEDIGITAQKIKGS